MNLSRKYKFLMVITPLIIVLDQITKWFIVKHLSFGERLPIIPGYFDLVHFRNRGAAFGIFAELPEMIRPLFFYIVALIALVALIFYFRSLLPDEKLLPLTLSLIFGGIVGNILDRLRHGEVVDFLSFHIQDKIVRGVSLEWPAFNIADSAITIAMVLLLISTFRVKK